MSYTITDLSKKIVIKLTTKMTKTIRLRFKRNGSWVNYIYGEPSDGVITYIIPCSDYQIGDVLSSFQLSMGGSYKIGNFNEGLTFLIDGEEYETVYTDRLTTKFLDTNEHTIQAVFKGNSKYSMSYTPKKLFKVNQQSNPSPVPSDLIVLEFVDKQNHYVYKDNQKTTFKLTQGGRPLVNQIVEVVSNHGTTTLQTRADGTVPFYNTTMDAGTFLLRAYYYQNNIVKAITQREVTVDKGEANIDVPENTYSVGDTIQIKFSDPMGNSLSGDKVTVYINEKVYNLSINQSGYMWIRFAHTGTFKFKIVYKGNKNLNAKTVEFTKTVTG